MPDRKDLNPPNLWNTPDDGLSNWGPNQMAMWSDQAFAQTADGVPIVTRRRGKRERTILTEDRQGCIFHLLLST